MKKILIAGGAGFIGQHLCKNLLDRGNYVICVDNYSTGHLKNVEKLYNYSNFEFIEHDVCDPLYVNVDEIYNLASPASPTQYQLNPVKTLITNVTGSYNLLALANTTGAKILQASTSEIYGDPLQHPQTENYFGNVNPVGVRSCYDEGKRAAETLFSDFRRIYGTETKIARIFNTYGPGMDENDGRVISNFIVQALTGKDITIYGTGLQTRSFCYVDDLVIGLIKLMETNISHPVNLGNTVEHTIKQLAEIIIKLTESDSKIVYKELPDSDPQRRNPDISLANSLLEWYPTTDINSGIVKIIDYFKDVLSI